MWLAWSCIDLVQVTQMLRVQECSSHSHTMSRKHQFTALFRLFLLFQDISWALRRWVHKNIPLRAKYFLILINSNRNSSLATAPSSQWYWDQAEHMSLLPDLGSASFLESKPQAFPSGSWLGSRSVLSWSRSLIFYLMLWRMTFWKQSPLPIFPLSVSFCPRGSAVGSETVYTTLQIHYKLYWNLCHLHRAKLTGFKLACLQLSGSSWWTTWERCQGSRNVIGLLSHVLYLQKTSTFSQASFGSIQTLSGFLQEVWGWISCFSSGPCCIYSHLNRYFTCE